MAKRLVKVATWVNGCVPRFDPDQIVTS